MIHEFATLGNPANLATFYVLYGFGWLLGYVTYGRRTSARPRRYVWGRDLAALTIAWLAFSVPLQLLGVT